MLRGMFEDRIQNVIREIKERPNLILFIDEVHTMIGAGSALGAPSDAANVFKSVLSRGEVRIIGATTLSEYKEFLQEDEALARRFRTVNVAEPTIEETRTILFSLRPRLERKVSFPQHQPCQTQGNADFRHLPSRTAGSPVRCRTSSCPQADALA